MTDWQKLVLSKIDPFKVRVIVKYTLLEQEPWKSTIDSHILPDAFEREVDRICHADFGIVPVPGAIAYFAR